MGHQYTSCTKSAILLDTENLEVDDDEGDSTSAEGKSGMAKTWDERPRARGGAAVLTNAGALGANFFLANRPWYGGGIILLGVVVTIILLWPEIKSFRLIIPKNTQVQSPVWLYIFAIALLTVAVYAVGNLYVFYNSGPRTLSSEDFASPYIHGKYIRIAELADSNSTIVGRTFEDDYIYGPAVLYPHDYVDLGNSGFTGTKDSVFMKTTNGMAGPGSGVIIVRDTKFRRCHFINITFVGTPEQIEQWQNGFTGSGK